VVSALAVFTVFVHWSEKLLKQGCSFPVGIVSKAIRIGYSKGNGNKSNTRECARQPTSRLQLKPEDAMHPSLALLLSWGSNDCPLARGV
jgi:hypothetical protein